MDSRYAQVDQLFDDYISYQVKGGETTANAQKILRTKLGALAITDAANIYIKKDAKLTDVTMANDDARKLACNHIGAAYKGDYQLKLKDTGWKMMSNYGSGTDCSRLYVRQIGNIVNIQGIVNTARREGGNWGGVVAAIPNTISAPPYGVRGTFADFNDDHKYNRGTSFKISGGSRHIQIYERGQYNVDLHLNFTYFV